MGCRIAIEEIYDAAFDEAAFDHLLARLTQAVGARSYVAGWHYTDGTATLFRTSGHWSDEHLAEYNRDFALTDIWNVAMLRNWRPAAARDMSDLVPDAEYESSELYNDLFRRIGDDTWRCVAVPVQNPWGVGAVTFHRGKSQQGFDPGAVRRLDAYAKHLAPLLALRGRMSALERRLGGAELMAGALGQAMLLVNGAGRLMQENEAAAEMLFRSGALRLRDGIVFARNPADSALKAAIAKATSPSDPQPGALTVRDANGRPLLLSVIAVPAAGGGRCVLIVASDPEARDATLADRLRALYRLSPGEACLAVRLAEGARPAEVAQERGVTLGTIRVQIKAVTAKLGCRRQADIVRIAKSLPPLRPPTG